MWSAQPPIIPRRDGSTPDGAVLDLTTGAICDRMLEVDPVALGDPEQVGRAPDDVILELGHLAIGIDQLPHHLDDALAALFVERAHDDAGEVIEVDGLALDLGSVRNQAI